MGIHELPEPLHQGGMLLATPLFHVAACHAAMLSCVRVQRKVVCMYKWDAELAMQLIERERLTSLLATPAISGDLVRAAKTHTDHNLSSLLVLGGGGAPRPPEQVREINQLTDDVVPSTGWGMTETNAIGAGIAASDYLERPASSGQCSAVLDFRIVGEAGQELAAGERGELQVRGTSMFRGYWNRPDGTVYCNTNEVLDLKSTQHLFAIITTIIRDIYGDFDSENAWSNFVDEVIARVEEDN